MRENARVRGRRGGVPYSRGVFHSCANAPRFRAEGYVSCNNTFTPNNHNININTPKNKKTKGFYQVVRWLRPPTTNLDDEMVRQSELRRPSLQQEPKRTMLALVTAGEAFTPSLRPHTARQSSRAAVVCGIDAPVPPAAVVILEAATRQVSQNYSPAARVRALA